MVLRISAALRFRVKRADLAHMSGIWSAWRHEQHFACQWVGARQSRVPRDEAMAGEKLQAKERGLCREQLLCHQVLW